MHLHFFLHFLAIDQFIWSFFFSICNNIPFAFAWNLIIHICNHFDYLETEKNNDNEILTPVGRLIYWLENAGNCLVIKTFWGIINRSHGVLKLIWDWNWFARQHRELCCAAEVKKRSLSHLLAKQLPHLEAETHNLEVIKNLFF